MSVFLFVDLLCHLCLSLLYCVVCFLQPCGHLLGKGCPFGFLVWDVFLCFCHFPFGVLGQVWYLIVLISAHCRLPYLED